jgi:iron(II)-dependent oxidoreductase
MTAPTASAHLVEMLRDARARTLELVVDLEPEQLLGPRLDIVNPLLCEIGHLAWFHEYFILRRVDGRASLLPNADALYNSATVPHDDRWQLPLPSLDGTLEYMSGVQSALTQRLKHPIANEEESFLYKLITFHEDMHGEAFTYSRQTLEYPQPHFAAERLPADAAAGPLPGDVEIPGGSFMLGSFPTAPFAFDNEKWAHAVNVRPFRMARAAVTNAEFAAFIDDRGYQNRKYWDDPGWDWRMSVNAEHPLYWIRQDGKWTERRFDRIEALSPHRPVIHVNWHEANAWCRWANRRLPSEVEWEVAASAESTANGALSASKRVYPWGDEAPTQRNANLDGHALGTVDVGACAAGDSAWGCRQMIGNVWEWTASTFEPFPGFSPDAYQEYSQPWFGSRKVLRGGAWATRGRMINNTYRNFFPPDRRDIFAGFRTVKL